MKDSIEAVIFDLDGVIVSTDNCHFCAWKRMADEEGISFDRQINERLRGVSRMESLDIVLEGAKRAYTDEEKASLAARKNEYYRQLLARLTPADVLPGAERIVREVRSRGVLTAIGSSSKNAPLILQKIGFRALFDAVADGNGISRSKPDPEVFLLAARLLNTEPKRCVVVEDAFAGILAAKAAGMKAIGVGYAQSCELADDTAASLDEMSADRLLLPDGRRENREMA